MATEKKLSQQYAITLTLNPKLFKLPPLLQRNALQGVLNELVGDEKLDLSVCCEFTQNGNIHAHGFVRVPLLNNKNPIYQINYAFKKHNDIMGYITVKPIDKYHGWLHYCLKDYEESKIELDGESPVCIDNMGDFSILDEDVQKVMNKTCDCGWKRPDDIRRHKVT